MDGKLNSEDATTVLTLSAVVFRAVCSQHFGTKNNILHERMALFSVLTPFAEKRQDDYQIYRYLRRAQRCCTGSHRCP